VWGTWVGVGRRGDFHSAGFPSGSQKDTLQHFRCILYQLSCPRSYYALGVYHSLEL